MARLSALFAAICFISLCFQPSAGELSCKDESGNFVEWFAVSLATRDAVSLSATIRLFPHLNSNREHMEPIQNCTQILKAPNGGLYMYYDAKQKQLVASPNNLDDGFHGALSYTLQ